MPKRSILSIGEFGSRAIRERSRPGLGVIILALSLAILAASCGDDDGSPGTTPTTSEPATTSTTAVTTTTTPPQTTTTAAAPTTSTTVLPGEPIDIGPGAGAVLGVVGVAFDDVLNVRAAPGTDQQIVTTLDPLADDVVATGEARLLPQSLWYGVTANGVTGWASASFLAWLGDTDDVTSQVVDALGPLPSETMLDLGRRVAEARASAEPPSRITMTVAPNVGDLGEVTFDVVGLGDDAVFGERLHIFGQPTDSGEGFSLKSVERTLLCGRGVADGLCV